MKTFHELGLQAEILSALDEIGFVNPTPIQEQAIPFLLESHDNLIARAQTGTGKTAAFGLPIIQKINTEQHQTQVLILSPTRELALQIANDLRTYAKYFAKLNIVTVYGGTSIDTQIRELSRGAQIVVGTPGRVLDLIKRRRLVIDQIRFLVLDEADEMLNMGFKDELDAILESTPADKQNLLFSATMPFEMEKIAKKYITNPHKITVDKENTGASTVNHNYYLVQARDRYKALKRVVDYFPNVYGIVFCRTRIETKEVADRLMQDGYNADALHGDLSQSQRDYVMARFRKNQIQLLIATDVAARGLDVDNLTHVINYDLPDDPEVYVHRSGRTGRAGKEGISVSILHLREKSKLRTIEKMVGKKFEKILVPSGTQICERQLFHLIDKMQNVDVDHDQIDQFIPAISEKLSHLSKEEIIKGFVSMEFNRFLDYYKNAEDINVSDKPERQLERSDRNDRGDRRDRNDRNDRGDRRDRNDRGDRRERSDRGDRSDKGGERSSDRAPKGDFQRFFINIGTKDNANIGDILSLVSKSLRKREAKIGKIDILQSFSFFEVEKKYSDKIIDSFKEKEFNGRELLVQLAENNDAKKVNKRRSK
jgi:ATP-dependent RNA helicase DeaD